MSVSAYKVGFKHGTTGVRYLNHRDGRPYDSDNDNRSYFNGFRDGSLKPNKLKKKVVPLITAARVTKTTS